tara:strand:+ start:1849 stop:2085 length:237 start_codon:yes stop_codon:yes gene_type:complete
MMLSSTIGILLLIFCFQISYTQQTKSALFLWNSYTCYNNILKLVDNLAQAVVNALIYDIEGYQLYQYEELGEKIIQKH